MKILVADDSKTCLSLLTFSLQKLGHEVVSATHGQQALELFTTEHPDLIILDVVMDGMDGFECAKKIRKLSKDDWVPIIFLSASVDDDSLAQGINAGGDDYLIKPCSEITLFAKIKAMQRIATMRRQLYEATQQLAALSSTDTLTGLYNRLQFDRTIQEKIKHSDRSHCKFALLFLDLDKFKLINDNLGHHIGDLLLIEVGNRLRACLRLNDFIARMGGDEFAIILDTVNSEEGINLVVERLLKALAPSYLLEGHTVHVTPSIGIAIYPKDGTEKTILLQKADAAMYDVKKSGRNNYKYFNNDIL